MKKTLLAIVALLLVSGAMAQDAQTTAKKSSPWTNDAGGVSWQFIKGGGNIDLDLLFFDLDFGWSKGDGYNSNSIAINVIQPFSLAIGDYFFIRPTIGIGYYHGEATVLKETAKSNAFDFLLFPKVGISIPLKNGKKITIYATYRYDAPNFKFQGKGCWGVGIGTMN